MIYINKSEKINALKILNEISIVMLMYADTTILFENYSNCLITWVLIVTNGK